MSTSNDTPTTKKYIRNSKALAEKYNKSHRNVMRDIKKIAKSLNIDLTKYKSHYISKQNKKLLRYELPKRIETALTNIYDYNLMKYKRAEGVYIVKMGNSKKYKVGSATNVKVRLKTLQTGNPYPLHLKYFKAVEDANIIERKIHKLLDDVRIVGEWFTIEDKLLDKIVSEYFS